MRTYTYLIPGFFLMLGCQGGQPEREGTRLPAVAESMDYEAAADSLNRAVPEHDARAAIAQGDRRFLGIQGYVVVVPGLGEREVSLYLDHPDSVRIIPGTSDGPVSQAHRAYNDAAARYAERYNDELLRLKSHD